MQGQKVSLILLNGLLLNFLPSLVTTGTTNGQNPGQAKHDLNLRMTKLVMGALSQTNARTFNRRAHRGHVFCLNNTKDYLIHRYSTGWSGNIDRQLESVDEQFKFYIGDQNPAELPGIAGETYKKGNTIIAWLQEENGHPQWVSAQGPVTSYIDFERGEKLPEILLNRMCPD